MKRIYSFKILIFLCPLGKFKSLFELAENLSFVLTKLETELGLAQPQLVNILYHLDQSMYVDEKLVN